MSSFGTSPSKIRGGDSNFRSARNASVSAVGPGFISRATSMLRGDFLGKGHWTTRVRACASNEEIHAVLADPTTKTNGTLRVAGRFQSQPEKIQRLVPADSIAGSVALGGGPTSRGNKRSATTKAACPRRGVGPARSRPPPLSERAPFPRPPFAPCSDATATDLAGPRVETM
jgi:hypothetical protein